MVWSVRVSMELCVCVVWCVWSCMVYVSMYVCGCDGCVVHEVSGGAQHTCACM